MLWNIKFKFKKDKLLSVILEAYRGKELEFGEEQMREIERVVLLRVVDQKWMAHIDNMDHLKQGMGLRAYKQQDPIQAYQMEGSAMFEEMIEGIKLETVKFLFHVRVERPVEREKVAEETSAIHGSDDKSLKKEPEVVERFKENKLTFQSDKVETVKLMPDNGRPIDKRTLTIQNCDKIVLKPKSIEVEVKVEKDNFDDFDFIIINGRRFEVVK